MSGAGKVVCVTGASGYIASWLVKMLLDRGYTVKASVRDLNDPRKTEHLVSLEGAMENLQLFRANLLEDGSFDAIVDGCECVFHTASPVHFSPTNPEAELLDPAVKGTLNVLRACAKVSSIKRVVLTSSMAAVAYNRELKDGVLVDESWFSDPSYCEENKMWYVLSKILAENAAWKFTKKHGIDMVVINPGMVIGPILQPSASKSVGMILNLVNGATSFSDLSLRWVDVRDVAYAHILAFEIPSASGRYCLVDKSARISEIVEVLRELYPTIKLPDNDAGASNDQKVQDDTQALMPKGSMTRVRTKWFEEQLQLFIQQCHSQVEKSSPFEDLKQGGTKLHCLIQVEDGSQKEGVNQIGRMNKQVSCKSPVPRSELTYSLEQESPTDQTSGSILWADMWDAYP